jgi:hypothetical protein
MPEKFVNVTMPIKKERFVQIVARYERLRSQIRESTRQAEVLFQGLLALSFAEELHESFG